MQQLHITQSLSHIAEVIYVSLLALKAASERRASLSEVVGEVIHDDWSKGCY
jgi:hypothetical protein